MDWQLSPEAHDAIQAAILCAQGNEICGCLLGDAEERQRFYQLPNYLASPHGVYVARHDYMRARRFAATRNLRIIAWVHSHTADLTLSPVDRCWLEADEIPWLIVVLTQEGLQYQTYAAS